MKGQFLFISSIVIGVILLSTASTVSKVQEEEFEPSTMSREIQAARTLASELNMNDPANREAFRQLVSRESYSAQLSYNSSGDCMNVRLETSNGEFDLGCLDKDGAAFNPLVSVLDKSDFETSGVLSNTTAHDTGGDGALRLGYRNGMSGDNLIMYWRMDDTSGKVKDYSGEGHEGTTYDFEGDERGRRGVFSTNGINFSSAGKGDWIESDEFDVNRDKMSFSYWVYIPAWGSSSQDDFARTVQIGGSNTSEPDNGVSHEANPGGELDRLKVVHWNGGNYNFVAEADILVGRWNHVVQVTDGDRAWIYINGVLNVTATGNRGTGAATSVITGKADYHPLNGSIDELRIYRENLTRSEVRKLYLGGRDSEFNGDYGAQFSIPSGESPDLLDVTSTVPPSTDAEFILKHSSGTTSRVTLDSGSNSKNYTTGISATGGQLDVRTTTNSTDPFKSPLIDSFKIWSD